MRRPSLSHRRPPIARPSHWPGTTIARSSRGRPRTWAAAPVRTPTLTWSSCPWPSAQMWPSRAYNADVLTTYCNVVRRRAHPPPVPADGLWRSPPPFGALAGVEVVKPADERRPRHRAVSRMVFVRTQCPLDRLLGVARALLSRLDDRTHHPHRSALGHARHDRASGVIGRVPDRARTQPASWALTVTRGHSHGS
jgi:hypothetical protein